MTLTLLPVPRLMEQTLPSLTGGGGPHSGPVRAQVCLTHPPKQAGVHVKHLLSVSDVSGALLGALSVLIH